FSTEVFFKVPEFDSNPIATPQYFDFYGNGQKLKIVLEDGQLLISQNDEEIFKSDPAFDVTEFLIGDFDNDGFDDLVLYLWKNGNYGDSLPFWEKENDDSYKFHLFLYSFEDGKMKSKWNSSNLPYINTQTQLVDIDNDGKNEMIVLERPYKWGKGQTGQAVAIWEWNEWGFWLEWRSDVGRYDEFSLEYI
ncbi:VCBS repeat-containing protein, partial [Patescibacteria group bacterium]|nr:VCBS repeat-containing protein [Patescibacteria group bacterium]